ncbi:MAG: lipopolysaccharide biosynthesis protein [Planctomycetota bacterium]
MALEKMASSNTCPDQRYAGLPPPISGSRRGDAPAREERWRGSTLCSTRLGREFVWISAGQGLTVLGAIIGVRLMTELLGPASYGKLALGMTVATLAQQVFLSPLGVTSQRFFSPSLEANQLGAYLRVVRGLATRIIVLLLVFGAVGVTLAWAMGMTHWLPLLLAAFLFAVISGSNGLFDSIQNAARHRQIVALHQAAAQWARFAVAAGLLILLGSTSTIAMLGYALASTVILASQWLFFRSKVLPLSPSSLIHDGHTVEHWARQMRGYMWPFATWGVFTWALVASDRWALQAFATTSSVGHYAVLYQLGYFPITMLCSMMMQLVSPVLFSRAGDGTDPERHRSVVSLNNRMLVAACLVSALATMLAFVLHRHVFWLLVAPEYRGVSTLLPWIVLSGGLFASGQVAALSVVSSINTKQLIPVKIVTAILGIGLNVSGACWFGLHGVVAANLAFSCVYFVWMLCLTRRQAGLSVELSINVARTWHVNAAESP